MSTEDRVKERFPNDIAEHELTVLHAHGLYRHLRFKAPSTSHLYVDVITWPGCLTVHGDMGTYTFSRIEDMLVFFAGNGAIDLHYWQEKLQGVERADTMVWDPASFRDHVERAYDDFIDDEMHGLTVGVLQDLREIVNEDLLDLADDESRARAAAYDFRDKASGFNLGDSWEWECRDYDYHFVWTCYALRHIAQAWLALPAPDRTVVAA